MDLSADLRLISTDNVVFLVHSFYLKAHRYVLYHTAGGTNWAPALSPRVFPTNPT
jgi:hypothetical protein